MSEDICISDQFSIVKTDAVVVSQIHLAVCMVGVECTVELVL